MIDEAYITKISLEEKKVFGFAETEDNKTVFIPGRVVEEFNLDEVDVGTKNKMHMLPDKKGGSSYVATTLLFEDNTLEAEIKRLKEILDDNGIDY